LKIDHSLSVFDFVFVFTLQDETDPTYIIPRGQSHRQVQGQKKLVREVPEWRSETVSKAFQLCDSLGHTIKDKRRIVKERANQV
jgi:hypothetical protein